MKLTDYLVAAAIGLLVGVGAYLATNSFLFTPERFQAEVEVVHKIDPEFDTESTDVFIDENRIDFSSRTELNSAHNPNPFDSEQ